MKMTDGSRVLACEVYQQVRTELVGLVIKGSDHPVRGKLDSVEPQFFQMFEVRSNSEFGRIFVELSNFCLTFV